MAGHLGSTWHPSISIRTNITKSEYPIWIKSTSGQLCGVPLKLRSAFRVGFLTHSHEQSFSLHQKHAWWDVTLFRRRPTTHCTIPPTGWGDRWTIRSPPLPIPINRLNGDDCSVTNYAFIMTTKVKKSSQHRGDTIPDPIKVLLQLKIKVRARSHTRGRLLLSF